MNEILDSLPGIEPGWVWLVGAGPGTTGLLTLLALRGLTTADVVVYDALVDQDALKLARPGATLEYAGKRVLRLKGGDPFVFGRGGEEAMSLVEAGVPFRIVPGISAGIGGLAYAGIPVTHRDTNSAVAFVTGHDATGAVPDSVDWASLAKGAPVIVIYMALKHIALIADRLLAAGRAKDEPVAVIAKATTAEQTVLETTLATCAVDVAKSGIEPPAMVVVGQVVRLRAALDWLGALSGRTLHADPLGTRHHEQTGS